MNVQLVDCTTNPEERIGRMAAICYDSGTTPEQCTARARACVSKGHLATLRFAYATFLIEGISRTCSHQLVRSKHLDYLQESQRYVNQSNAEFVYPDTKLSKEFNEAYTFSLQIYQQLIDAGVKKEDARFVLPNASTTRLYVTGNFQAWLDFIKLRSGKEAQWEIRNVAHSIAAQLREIAPNIFGEINGT